MSSGKLSIAFLLAIVVASHSINCSRADADQQPPISKKEVLLLRAKEYIERKERMEEVEKFVEWYLKKGIQS